MEDPEDAVVVMFFPSYPQVLGHVEQLLSQTAEGGQQEAHALICSESSLTERSAHQ